MAGEQQTQVAFAHYETTVSDLRRYIRYRYRYLFYSLLLAFVSLLHYFFPQDMQEALKTVLDENLNLPESTDFRLIQFGLLVALMLTVARYFQIVMSVDRQQEYVRHLEDKINCLLPGDLVTFEGKFYDAKKHAGSRLYKFLYRHVVPAAIFVTSILNTRTWIPSDERVFQVLDATAIATSLLTVLLVLSYWNYVHQWTVRLEERTARKTTDSNRQSA